MAVPTTRAQFVTYCLRKLGAPVNQINIDEDQIEDRVDESLQYYWDYHFDGADKEYYKHLITQQDVDNKYITLPENIIGVVKIFPFSNTLISPSDYMFDVRYQIALNDLYSIGSSSLVPYMQNMMHLSLISEILIGEAPIRYNRHMDRLHIDTDWKRLAAGKYVIVEAYRIVDPETYPDVWKDRWLQRYCTALLKENWGTNLTKFSNMVLPGGVQFNGERILSDAQAEIAKLEDQMSSSFSLPAVDMMG